MKRHELGVGCQLAGLLAPSKERKESCAASGCGLGLGRNAGCDPFQHQGWGLAFPDPFPTGGGAERP